MVRWSRVLISALYRNPDDKLTAFDPHLGRRGDLPAGVPRAGSRCKPKARALLADPVSPVEYTAGVASAGVILSIGDVDAAEFVKELRTLSVRLM